MSFSNMPARELWWMLMPNLFFSRFDLSPEEEVELRDILALICAEHIKIPPRSQSK